MGKWKRQASFTMMDKRKKVTVLMIASMTLLIFSDQNLIAPNLTMIATEFGLDEKQRDWLLGGMLSTLFFLIGAPASMVGGVLADTRRRTLLLSAVAMLGAIPCLLTTFVKDYVQLLLTRMFTGIALGGAIPIIFSLIGDIFPSSQRTYVTGAFSFVAGAGQTMGQFVAGMSGQSLGWRFSFVFVGLPTVLIALVNSIFAEEPIRGAADGQQQRISTDFSMMALLQLFKIKSNLLIFFQAGLGCIPWGVISAYLNDYLAQDSGLGVIPATYVFMYFSGGAAIGGIFGSFVGQQLQNRDRFLLGIFIGLSAIVAIPPILFLVIANGEVVPLSIYYICAFCGGFMASPTGANVNAIVINSNSPETRGTAVAIFNLFNDVGKGLGPFFGAALIRAFGRRVALSLSIMSWIPCGIACTLLAWTYPHDQDRMRSKIDSTEDSESNA